MSRFHRVCLLMAVGCMIVGSWAVQAQDGTRFQRLLPLPEQGPGDIATQFRFLQELQRLMQENPRAVDTSQSQIGRDLSDQLKDMRDSLSGEQLRALEALLKQFPASQPNENNNDASRQSTVQNLLEHFQRTGQLPQLPGPRDAESKGVPFPLPDAVARSQSSSARQSAGFRQGGSTSTQFGDGEALQDSQNSDSSRQNRESGVSSGSSNNGTGGRNDTRANGLGAASNPLTEPRAENGFAGGQNANTGSVVSKSATEAVEREAIKNDLARKGLARTLQEIVKQSQLAARDQGAASGGPVEGKEAVSGWEGKILRSLDGAGKKLADLAKESLSQSKKSGKESGEQSATAGLSIADEDSAELAGRTMQVGKPPVEKGAKDSSSWWAQAKELYQGLTTTAESNQPGSDRDQGFGSLPGSPPMFWVACLAAAGLAFFLWRRSSVAGQQAPTDRASLNIDPKSIELVTRDDIVKAFHALSLTVVSGAQPWWNHRRAVSKMHDSLPSVHSAFRSLADIYELARYAPREQRLAPEQIAMARTAIEQILLTSHSQDARESMK